MQTALTYRTNRDLFSNYYLDEHLPETEEWDEVSEDELQESYDDVMDLWEREKGTAPKRNESQLEEKFIRPMFRKLGIPFEVEESTDRTQRRPDYGFFDTEQAARDAFERREEGGNFYQNAVAVADAKRWGRPLDTRGTGEHERDFENPSYQIHVYLQETPARWAILTDGKKWRLYYGPTSHRLDSYYEVDLPTILEKGDLGDFKYFYLFFRHEAFLEDASGDSFLDDVYDESNVFARELGEDLQDNIYEAIKILSEGYLQYPESDLDESDLDLIHDSSLIYLYRLIFVLYAEAEGRELLDTNNEIYEESYSLNSLKQEVAEELESGDPKYRDWQDNLQDRLDELFTLIDQGSKSRGIPEDDLFIPAYNGGLFRTDPDDDDSPEAKFLDNHDVGDAYLARVIELLTRSQNGNGGGKIFVDYSSLDVRHLGSIYEGLLEYQLNVADEPLTVDDGEYVSADDGDDVIVQKGEVHLTTGSGERKATGSYYTPEYIVEYIVENTLEPLVDDIRADLAGRSARGDDRGFAEEFAERVFDLKILDPAMGSGHFLTSAIDYLAREIIDAQEKQAAQQGIETVDEDHDINWARRQVAQRCIYGVDLNPLAVELAKVSLWLRTLAAEQPLAFLDHHLKTGNSLVGSDIEEIEELESESGGDEQNASLADFGVARKGTIEQLMRIYEDFIAIENQDLADVKEMESKYDEFERNKLRQRLEAMANVHTAEHFGLGNVPSDAYERMAAGLEENVAWESIKQMQWFQDAQAWASEDRYFHWAIEFPEVFYDTAGTKQTEGGFDVVIGNPPYVRQEQISAIKPFLKSRYQTYDSAADLYVYFIEKGVSLLRESGEFGYIVSNKFMRSDYGRSIRELLTEDVSLVELIDFHELPVFSREVSTYPLIIRLQNETNKDINTVKAAKIDGLDFDSLSDRVDRLEYDITKQSLSVDGWSLADPEAQKTLEKIENTDKTLVEYLDEPLYRGVLTGLNDAFIIGKDKKEQLLKAGSKIEQFVFPLLKGDDIERYHIDFQDRYLIRIPSGWTQQKAEVNNEQEAWEWFQSQFPALADHLSSFEEEAKDRYDRGECWWELRPCDYYDKFEGEKIVYPDISDGSTFAYDNEGYYMVNTCYFFPTSQKRVLALLNSSVISWYYEYVTSEYRGGYNRSFTSAIEEFPVPAEGLSRGSEENEIDKETVDDIAKLYSQDDIAGGTVLEYIASRVQSCKKEKSGLNTNIMDYVGTDLDGETLATQSQVQPAPGVATTILSETSDTFENLRISEVDFVENGENLQLRVRARYKPENPEEHDTDTWGYTTTKPIPAIEFKDVSWNEKIIFQELIRYVINEADDGVAGFRKNATKSNSLIDRLNALVLPDVDTQPQLEQYLDTRKRANALDEEIENLASLVDQIVYDLYNLSEDEREMIDNEING